MNTNHNIPCRYKCGSFLFDSDMEQAHAKHFCKNIQYEFSCPVDRMCEWKTRNQKDLNGHLQQYHNGNIQIQQQNNSVEPKQEDAKQQKHESEIRSWINAISDAKDRKEAILLAMQHQQHSHIPQNCHSKTHNSVKWAVNTLQIHGEMPKFIDHLLVIHQAGQNPGQMYPCTKDKSCGERFSSPHFLKQHHKKHKK